MLDLATEKGRLVSAALGLAAERAWHEVTLAEIAARAGKPLVDLREHFRSKSEILTHFIRLVDDEVLRRAPRRSEDQAARDLLFDILMSRFDVLGPHKNALRSIAASGLPDPVHVGPVLASQRWMLEAAGIGTDGLEGGLKVAGLASVYAGVFRIWLDDEDPGLARTMAALDRRLRRGERTLASVAGVCAGLNRVASAMMGATTRRSSSPSAEAPPVPPEPAPPI